MIGLDDDSHLSGRMALGGGLHLTRSALPASACQEYKQFIGAFQRDSEAILAANAAELAKMKRVRTPLVTEVA